MEVRIARAKITEGVAFAESTLTDAISGAAIESVRGNSTKFQFGLFDPDDAVSDISQIASMTIQIRKSQMEGSTVLAQQTIASGSLDATLDATTWGDRTKQHVEFEFTDAEMNFDPGGPLKRYWLTVKITTLGGVTNVISAGFYVHHESNSAAGSPTENPGTSLSLEEADARFVRYDGDQALNSSNQDQVMENMDLLNEADDGDQGVKLTRNEDGGFDLELWDQGTNSYRRVRLDNGAVIAL